MYQLVIKEERLKKLIKNILPIKFNLVCYNKQTKFLKNVLKSDYSIGDVFLIIFC